MEFIKFIQQYKGQTVYIQTHNFPDADALGSAYGLARFIEHFGVKSILCFDGKIDKLSTRKIIEELHMEIFCKSELKDMTESSPIILVDSQKNAGNVTDLIGDEVAAIDHHPTVVDIDYHYRDVRMMGACCTMITQYFREAHLTPDALTATALLYGLKMDTNHFTRGVTAEDIDAYAYLNPLADSNVIKRISSNNLEFSDLSAYGAVFDNIQVFDRVGISFIPFACPDALIAMVSDFVLALDNVDFVVIYAKRTMDWKFSVRSEDDRLDAGEIIHEALLGLGSGGGHACMAGGLVPIDKIKELGVDPDKEMIHILLDVINRLDVV